MKPYTAKSLASAQRVVRQLRKQIKERDELLTRFDIERRLLARLAADTPQFSNPMDLWAAKRIRDRILSPRAGA